MALGADHVGETRRWCWMVFPSVAVPRCPRGTDLPGSEAVLLGLPGACLMPWPCQLKCNREVLVLLCVGARRAMVYCLRLI